MYNNNYEEYMRSVLGYNNRNNVNSYNENYEQNYYANPLYNANSSYNTNTRMIKEGIEDLYPDTYRIINPIISRICQNNTKPLTKELLEEMTNEVCKCAELKDINDMRQSQMQDNKDNRKTSVHRNSILRDLIKILILNKILGGNLLPGRPRYNLYENFPRI